MIVDSSAIVAVLQEEEDAAVYATALLDADAKATNEPLLFKGSDFPLTDVTGAI